MTADFCACMGEIRFELDAIICTGDCMTPEHWQHIKEIFHGALERPPGDRVSYHRLSLR